MTGATRGFLRPPEATDMMTKGILKADLLFTVAHVTLALGRGWRSYMTTPVVMDSRHAPRAS